MPQILGPTAASELLLNNKVFTAEEMFNLNFVRKIIDPINFNSYFREEIEKLSGLPPEALKLSKKIIRNEQTVKSLTDTNDAEIERNCLY